MNDGEEEGAGGRARRGFERHLEEGGRAGAGELDGSRGARLFLSYQWQGITSIHDLSCFTSKGEDDTCRGKEGEGTGAGGRRQWKRIQTQIDRATVPGRHSCGG